MTPIDISNFSAQHIATRPHLGQTHNFPHDLWRAMAAAGLMGRYIDPAYGGQGMGWSDLQDAVARMVRHGGNPGIVLSWMLHGMASRFVLGAHADDGQKARYLPRLAAGEITLSIAVSEPGMGGSPKRLATTAEKDGDGWVLNGQKMYLTNGPIADLFIVFAVTGVVDGRKEFGAFFVERGATGLTATAMGSVDFLLPSPHGGLDLTDCRVPDNAQIAAQNNAFATIAKPFRVVEDIISLGVGLGGMAYQLDHLIATSGDGTSLADAAGELAALRDGSQLIAARLAEELEAGTIGDTYPPSLLAARRLGALFGERVQAVLDERDEEADPAMAIFMRDMAKLGGLGAGIARARQRKLGLSLLAARQG